jgi:hypothetical protein
MNTLKCLFFSQFHSYSWTSYSIPIIPSSSHSLLKTSFLSFTQSSHCLSLLTQHIPISCRAMKAFQAFLRIQDYSWYLTYSLISMGTCNMNKLYHQLLSGSRCNLMKTHDSIGVLGFGKRWAKKLVNNYSLQSLSLKFFLSFQMIALCLRSYKLFPEFFTYFQRSQLRIKTMSFI